MGISRLHFSEMSGGPIGFYPIVNRFSWIERLVPFGVKTIQLRIKDLNGAALTEEIERSVKFCKKFDCRLFINDYWQQAIEFGGYGVHLGQEDLGEISERDLGQIADSGVRLGISTHSTAEAVRATILRPSYLALGPIFPTTCKSMSFGPQGIEMISRWKNEFPYPIVAIGGLKLRHVKDALHHGADGIAVISDVTEAANPDAQTRLWLAEVAGAKTAATD